MSQNPQWHDEETYRSLMQYGAATMKFVMYSNGGAAVALLSYLGAIHRDASAQIDMRIPMGFFIAGVLFGGCATYTAYLTQLMLFNESKSSTNHQPYLRGSLLLVAFGILSFAVGAFIAVSRFANHVSA